MIMFFIKLKMWVLKYSLGNRKNIDYSFSVKIKSMCLLCFLKRFFKGLRWYLDYFS